jgi:hypothetical protein
MSLSLPSNPTTGQTFSAGGRTWYWTGSAWELVASGTVAGSVTIGDPLWDSTVLMLHCNSLADSSSLNATPAVTGQAAATGSPKFGAASLTFDGSGDYISYGSNPLYAFGTGDFTIECWFKAAAVKNQYFMFLDTTGGSGFGFEGGKLTLGKRATTIDLEYAYTPTVGEWTHYAACRSGTTLRLFINGSQVATTSNTINYLISGPLLVGGIVALSDYSCNGQIDEFRITRAARYTANFTPQTAAFQDGQARTFSVAFS